MMLEREAESDPEVTVRLFNEFGLAGALGPLPCVLSVDDVAAFADGPAARLPASQIVLQVPALRCVNGSGKALSQLAGRGFRLMLAATPDGPAAPPGFQAFSYDCSNGVVPTATTGWLQHLPGPHLALGVDTYQRFRQCAEAGFAWLAGDYALHPTAQAVARGDGPGQALLLRLLALVVSDADTRAIEAVMKQDPQLSYQLLRLVNSSAFARPTRIASFAQAITLLGRRELQRWLQLLIYAHSGHGTASPLLPRAAFRARLMENLCTRAGGSAEEQDQAFMTGMFSLLDVLFGRPLPELVEPLGLSERVTAALLAREGRLGQLLAVTALSKRGPAPALRSWLAQAGLGPEHLAAGLVEACGWTVAVVRES